MRHKLKFGTQVQVLTDEWNVEAEWRVAYCVTTGAIYLLVIVKFLMFWKLFYLIFTALIITMLFLCLCVDKLIILSVFRTNHLGLIVDADIYINWTGSGVNSCIDAEFTGLLRNHCLRSLKFFVDFSNWFDKLILSSFLDWRYDWFHIFSDIL